MVNQTDSLDSSWVNLGTHKTTGGRCHSGNSGTEREEGVEVLGGRSQETPAVPEDELGDFQCSSFGDDYEIIEVSDLNGMRIAGFSKQELLELCNFCKIGYGNNDKKLDSRYKTKAELINEGYGIIPFYYNERNIRCAGFVFTKDKEITIAYRGTQDFDDVITDVSTALTSEILPEGGKMHNGFCNAFYDSLPSLSKILDSYAKEQGSEIKDFKINCTGHSMGAALATITALYLKKVKDAEYVRVATFGSPRVFDFHGVEIYEKLLGENTIRVTNSSDPIPMFPSGSMGFKHVGKPLKIKTGNFVISCFGMSFCVVGGYYHKTDTYYNCIQDIKPEDFQPDNNVSRYYYFSYVVAAPYCITTTILTTPYYLFLSAISNTERHYFEKEMKFADLIIHKNAMVGEDPLIMSHIECNINGRGEVPLYINNNGNSMELRQLCGTENISVRFLSSIGDNLVAGGSLAMRSTCSNSELSQQPQENIVDSEKDTMNSGEASEKKPISNNCEEDEVSKGNGSNNQHSSRKKSLILVRKRSNGTKTSTANTDEFITTENQPNNLHNGKNARLVQSTKQGKGLISKIPCLQLTLTNGNNSGSQKFNSRKSSSKQPQENVDRRENIMNNREGSTEELISNSFEEGEMYISDQNTKSIEEALSDAIFSLDCKEVRSLVERVKQEGNNVERIIGGALKKANETKVRKRDEGSKDKIKKIRKFLAEELKSIAASLVGNDVKITASSHEAPVIESKESESDSLSSEDDDYSRLESDKSAGTSSDNGFSFEEVGVTSEMPSMATEEAKVNNEQSDNINDDDLTPVSSPVSGDVLTSRSDEEESVVITQGSQNDGEHDKAVPEKHQDDALEKDLIDFSSDDDNSLLGDPVPTSTNEISGRTDGTQTSTRQLGKPISPSVPPTMHVSQNNINVQPSNSTSTVTATRSSTPTTQVVPKNVPAASVPPVTSKSSGQADNVQINSKQSTNPSNIANASSDVNSKPITKEPVATESNQQNSLPPLSSFDLSSPQRFVDDKVSSITGVLRSEVSIEDNTSSLDITDDEYSEDSSVVSEDSLIEDVTDEKEPLLDKTNKGDSTLKSSNSPQSTKSSKLPVIAASALAVAGVVSGVAIAVYLEMLTAGIAVGVCCLVAALIIYCCNRPSNSLEGSNVEPVANGKLVGQQ